MDPAQQRAIQDLQAALALLREPAGKDPRFSSLTAIKENFQDFIAAANAGYKKLHLSTIPKILEREHAIVGARKRKAEHEARAYEFSRLLWYRINDSIVWLMLSGQRHEFKRLMAYRPRPSLLEQRPEPIFSTLSEIYADPHTMAVWNDCTTCVDIGDIFAVNKITGECRFVEVKAGDVNREVSKALESGAAARTEFIEKYKEAGRRQLERFERQHVVAEQVLHILREEKGFDPFAKHEISIVETKTPAISYDGELQVAIEAAKTGGMSIRCVDDCLWLFATTETNRERVITDFRAHLEARLQGKALNHLRAMLERADVPTLFDLRNSFYYPMTQPLYLRGIRDEALFDLVFGSVSVFLYFDWTAFENLVKAHGANFRWSSEKEGRRARARSAATRPLVILGRVPIIQIGDFEVQMGAPRLLCILCDGQTPSSLAQQEVEGCEASAKAKR